MIFFFALKWCLEGRGHFGFMVVAILDYHSHEKINYIWYLPNSPVKAPIRKDSKTAK